MYPLTKLSHFLIKLLDCFPCPLYDSFELQNKFNLAFTNISLIARRLNARDFPLFGSWKTIQIINYLINHCWQIFPDSHTKLILYHANSLKVISRQNVRQILKHSLLVGNKPCSVLDHWVCKYEKTASLVLSNCCKVLFGDNKHQTRHYTPISISKKKIVLLVIKENTEVQTYFVTSITLPDYVPVCRGEGWYDVSLT